MRRIATAATALALLAGCETGRRAGEPPLTFEDRPLTDRAGHSRSLAFEPRRLQAAQDPADPGSEPWYTSRNDARAAVQAGVEYPRLMTAETRTVDRQAIFFGEPQTHYDQRTYRSEVVRGIQ